MKTLLFKELEEKPLAEFNDPEVFFEKGDIVFFTKDKENKSKPHFVVGILYNIAIWNGKADLTKQIYIRGGEEGNGTNIKS